MLLLLLAPARPECRNPVMSRGDSYPNTSDVLGKYTSLF